MSKIRRATYRAGSVLGDVEALASGSPAKIGKRIIRKTIWKAWGKFARSALR
jgi:hypothetical protein